MSRTKEGQENNRRSMRQASLARSRALTRLAALHPEEFAVILHEEKHKMSYSHRHSSDNPETIAWWGSEAQQ